MKKANAVRRFRAILLPLLLMHGTLRFDVWGALDKAPFTRLTNDVLSSELAMSISAAWGDIDNQPEKAAHWENELQKAE